MIRNTCGKFQFNTSSGYLENKLLDANFNLGCDANAIANAVAGGNTIDWPVYKYIVELKTHRAWDRDDLLLQLKLKKSSLSDILSPANV